MQTYDAIFKALRAVKPLVASEPHLVDTIATSVEVALQNLMKDLNTFTASETEMGKKTFTEEYFPLGELIATNKSILDAITCLDEARSKHLMAYYLDKTPIPVIIDLTLRSTLQTPVEASTDIKIFESP